MNLQMASNSWGDEWVEQRVLDLNVQPAAKAKTKEDQDLEDMETQLQAFLGNKATSAAWFDQMVKWTSHGKQDGWSRSTFDRRLKKLKDDGRVTGGGKQGDLYSVAHTEEANRTRHGNATEPPSVKPPSVKPPSTVTPKGGDGGDGGFEDRQEPSNHRQDTGDGGSRTDSKNDDTTDEPDLVADAMKQVRLGRKRSGEGLS